MGGDTQGDSHEETLPARVAAAAVEFGGGSSGSESAQVPHF